MIHWHAINHIYHMIHTMKELRLQITEELHKQLRQRALDEELTLKRLTTKALEEYIRKRQKEESRRRRMSESAR